MSATAKILSEIKHMQYSATGTRSLKIPMAERLQGIKMAKVHAFIHISKLTDVAMQDKYKRTIEGIVCSVTSHVPINDGPKIEGLIGSP